MRYVPILMASSLEIAGTRFGLRNATAFVLAVLFVFVPLSGHAQSFPASPGGDVSGGGGAKIPVSAPTEKEVLNAEAEVASTKAAPVSLEQPIDPNTYICGPGDVYELNFWGKQNLRLRIAADLEGRVFISKVGFIDVAGKTLTAVRAAAKKKVLGVYPGLQLELVLVAPRSFLVHVVGYVKQPGVYSTNPLERLSAVLARAGGVSGSRRRIVVQHRDGSKQVADLTRYEMTGETQFDPYVLDGDTIRVPHAETVVSIAGAVRKPGRYELVNTKDLAELLDLAGGLTSSAAPLPVQVVRRNDQQQAMSQDVAIKNGVPKFELKDDDAVQVRGASELERSVLVIGAVATADPLDSAATSKRLPFVEGDTVQSLIDRAGGIRATGDLHRAYISRPRKNASAEVIPVDLEALLVRRDFTADKRVNINDTIVIPSMQYSVLVEGAVARPGLYPYSPRYGAAEYIARAGGRTRTARDLEDVKLIDPDGATHSFKAGKTLAPGDAILVPERNWSRSEIVQLVFAGAGLVISTVALTYSVTR
jgi:polysaccharide biosynthesis/export protein